MQIFWFAKMGTHRLRAGRARAPASAYRFATPTSDGIRRRAADTGGCCCGAEHWQSARSRAKPNRYFCHSAARLSARRDAGSRFLRPVRTYRHAPQTFFFMNRLLQVPAASCTELQYYPCLVPKTSSIQRLRSQFFGDTGDYASPHR